jgi:hypothetical protein
MSKLGLILIGTAAALIAFVLFALGRRRIHVDQGAARTMRGRFLVAVAFFLAAFGGTADRVFGADKPPAIAAKQLSLAGMKTAVQKILSAGPSGNDWSDPSISPNVMTVLEKAGLIGQRLQVTCYFRTAVPAKARGQEVLALQKQLLDEKVTAGVIPEEVVGKITPLPAQKGPGTPAEVRAYQKKVRRAARLLYKAGELDSGTIKKLEAAVGIPIARLDPLKAAKADATYVLASSAPWQWPPEARKLYLAMLAKHGIINKVKTRRGEMRTFGEPNAKALETAKAQIAKAEKLLADPKYAVTLPQDKKAKPSVLRPANAALNDYQLKVRRAARILISEKLLRTYNANALSKMLGVPLYGPVPVSRKRLDKPEILRPTCYRMGPQGRGPDRIPTEQRRQMLSELRRSGVLTEHTVAKLDRADEPGL